MMFLNCSWCSSQRPEKREVQVSALVEDDFWSCNFDDDDAWWLIGRCCSLLSFWSSVQVDAFPGSCRQAVKDDFCSCNSDENDDDAWWPVDALMLLISFSSSIAAAPTASGTTCISLHSWNLAITTWSLLYMPLFLNLVWKMALSTHESWREATWIFRSAICLQMLEDGWAKAFFAAKMICGASTVEVPLKRVPWSDHADNC